VRRSITFVGAALLAGSIGAAAAAGAGGSDAAGLTYRGARVEEGRRILLDADSYPRKPARLVAGPTVRREGKGAAVSFALDAPDDVLVRVFDGRGKVVRNLACGVLGDNAPGPLKPQTLKQELVWDGLDDERKAAPPGKYRVRVEVGLAPRFERFVAYDPQQLPDWVSGLEVDPKGRVYVALVAPYALEVRRFDRDGKYLEAVYPQNPNHLAAVARKREMGELFTWDSVGGRPVPDQPGIHASMSIWGGLFGGGHHPATTPVSVSTYWRLFPLRIGLGGEAYLVGYLSGWTAPWLAGQKKGGLVRYKLPSLDPPWALARMRCYNQAWALDGKGCAYIAFDHTVRKIDLTSGKALAHFEYNGDEKLPQRRAFLGTPTTRNESGWGVGNSRLGYVKELAVDRAGNLLLAEDDLPGLKVYLADGRFAGRLMELDLAGEKVHFSWVHGVCAVPGNWYVLAEAGKVPIPRKRGTRSPPKGLSAKTLLLKLTDDPSDPKAVWALALDPKARHLAVDTSRKPSMIWVGNGHGPATFSRVIDGGGRPGEVRHFGGPPKAKGVVVAPGALALDTTGRIFIYDVQRQRVIRTNDEGSQWMEFDRKLPKLQGMFVDRRRGHLYLDHASRWVRRYDLDLEEEAVFDTDKGGRGAGSFAVRLGGTDEEGNLYVLAVHKYRPEQNRVDQFGPDGRLKKKGYCRLYSGGNLAVDRRGAVYVTDTAQIRFALMHDAVAGFSRRGRRFRAGSGTSYLVKFAPGGGVRGGESELWAHVGVSPVLGGCSCYYEGNSVALDEAGRVFATEMSLYHVKAFDAAGNLLARIGAWGSTDCLGPGSRYPQPAIACLSPGSVAAAGDALYVSDRGLRRVVKVRLRYRQCREAIIKL